MVLKIKQINAKSVLNPSKIFDYCLNPYTGCQINCKYCYARLFMRRYSGHHEPWGEFVDVKINAPEVLRRQLERAPKGVVWISSVCDPYQAPEATYEMTRRCLKELVLKQFPVNIQTKSTLVLRDLDLLQEFERIEVGMTITTDNEKTARAFEPGAPPVKERLKALGKIHSLGIRTFAFVGPLLPGNPEKLAGRLEGKVDKIFVDKMNYMNSIKKFYRQSGLEKGTTDSFFHEHKERLVYEMEKRKIPCDVLF